MRLARSLRLEHGLVIGLVALVVLILAIIMVAAVIALVVPGSPLAWGAARETWERLRGVADATYSAG